jgi:hypothetical protein
MAECQLRRANGDDHVPCDEERCAYWRVAESVGAGDQADGSGCAIQHFQLLEGGREVAEWLLSVKQRVESTRER